MIEPRYKAVFGACLTQGTVIGLLFAYGLLIKELETEFGWSRTLLSSCTSVAFLGMGVFAILGGTLSDKYGPRLVLCFTGLSIGVGFALISQVTAAWHLFVIFGVFVALGMGTHDVVTLSIVARWFEKRRGIMTAVVKIGTALGQAAVPPLMAILILMFGWRDAVLMIGISSGILLVIAALNTSHPNIKKSTHKATTNDGMLFEVAKKTKKFWALCLIQLMVITSLLAIPVHIAVHGMDLGMSATRASGLLSIIGISSIAGRISIGVFFDKVGGRGSFLLCLLPLALSLFGFALVESHSYLFFMVAIYGFGHGGFFTVTSPVVANLFGTKAHGKIFGTVLFFGSIGGAIGPIVVGRVFDVTGSYQSAFITLGCLILLALFLSIILKARNNNLSTI